MGWVTDASIRRLLEAPLPPDKGGYAAVVCVVSRAEGDGVVHRQHLGDWSSIHDLTGRHVAVITPDPAGVAVVDIGVAVRGIALFGDEHGTRLVNAGPWPRPPAYAPTLPMPLDEHATAVTTVATELQEYFGIAEETLPCAVIVCTAEQQVVVVGLNRRITLYGLLKHVKSELEPQLARLNRARAEMEPYVAERQQALAELAEAERRAAAWRSAVAARKEWVKRREQLAAELTDLAADVDADTAALCRWLAARLPEDRTLDRRDATRAETLFTALSSRIGNLPSRKRQSLLRRLRRAVAALGTNVAPVPEEPDADLADLTERASRSQAAYHAISAKHSAAGGLDMLGAVRSAANRLGLDESCSGLLSWREVRWPVTAFIPPPHRAPLVRRDRG
ncbi:hypothetical protein [Amycolatopsis taiwanensis]|uniref:hypothetical protein n=1 Tax=Amycolatopsis taiwanensis TaxID=342230 RepID=UPI000488DAED|nr:hypothetical protein [Amycolatopsis taiwanensis]